MKKKVFSLMMMLLLAFMGVAKAEVVTIGDGTSTNYVTPFNSLWGYSFVEQIFTADEIGTAGTINAISFNMSSTDSQTNQVDVFMKAVTRTSFSDATDYETVTANDMVFSGTVTFNNGWTTITLSTPFEYDGTSNLMIGMHEYTSGYSTCYFYYTSAADKVITFHSDSADPNPYDLGSYTGNKYTSANRANIQIDITAGEGGDDPVNPDEPGYTDGLHVLSADGTIDTVNVGSRPLNAWMAPYVFKMYNESNEDYTVTVLDFTPNDGVFENLTEVPYELAAGDTTDITIDVHPTEAGVINRQFVAIYEGTRLAHIWPITAEAYTPECPDVVEVAYDFGTIEPGFEYIGIPAEITPTELHNDYTLPYPEIPEGVDGVYKMKFDKAVMLSARVSQGENGKVALYTEDFYGEEGPMATNNYTDPMSASQGGGGATGPFEAVIGDETSTTSTSYVPYYQLYYNSISESLFTAEELSGAGVTRTPMTSLSWYANADASFEAHGIKIWMANVSDTELTTTSHLTSGMTLVYQGDIQPVTGWNEFVFNQGSFAWDGQSNVIVCVLRNDSEWHSGPTWKALNAGFVASAYNYSDGTVYNSASSTYTVSTMQNRPIIKMKGGNRALSGYHASREGLALTHAMETVPGATRNNNMNFGGMHRGSQAYGICIYANGVVPEGMITFDVDDIANATVTGDFAEVGGMAFNPNTGTYYVSYYDGSTLYEIDAEGNVLNIVDTDYGIISLAWDVTTNTLYSMDGYNYLNITDPATGSMTDIGYMDADVMCMTIDAEGQLYALVYGSPASLGIINKEDATVSIVGELGANCNYAQSIAYDPNTNKIYWAQIDDTAVGNFYEVDPTTAATTLVTANTGEICGLCIPAVAAPVEPGMAGCGPQIDSLNVLAGTYYLVASSTDPDFEVTINIDELPCPESAIAVYPVDNAQGIEPNSVTLKWQLSPYCTEWRLVFSSTYWPDDEPNNPFTIITDWSSELNNTYTVTNLFNNTNYFWRIDQRTNGGEENGGCTTTGDVFGFTTHFNNPHNLTASDETIFEGQTVTLTWNAVVDRTYRQYRIYKDGEVIGTTAMNQINATSFVVPATELTYNMEGYEFYVTALYDEGESDPSNSVNVKVSGYSNETGINGYAYEQDGTTPIEGVTVTITGTDEFGDAHTYTATTDANGYYHVQVYVGHYTNAVANKEGYQTTVTNHELPFDVALNGQVNDVNFIMDENFVAPAHVCAELVEVDGEELVKVWWDFDFYNALIEDFETGDLSKFDWVNSASYPWTVTTTSPYEGTYCLKSGGAGVASVQSDLSVTVDVPNDGKISFYIKPSCEQNWDYGYFYIDGTQKGSFTGAGSWAEKKYDITAGEHTFMWQYKKDGSVNANDDCVYLDYITFNVLPEPVQPGWHTYCESEFDNAYKSNVGDPSWGYEYPVSLLSQYAGYNLTKVAVFSDDMYGAVGGNFTCNVYVGGSTPASGTLASTITVDVPTSVGDWVEYDLTTPVAVTGTDPIWVLWTVNTYAGMGYPAGCASHSSDYGDWWNNGQDGWEHMGDCTWTMKNYFAGRDGRLVALEPVASTHPMSSNLRAFVKGEEANSQAVCVNPNATPVVRPAKDGNRALDHYNIYRTSCYNDGPYNDTNTVFLATVWRPDTAYFDVSWPEVEPGIYKWGVSSVYAGNRVDYPAEPRESDIVWSNECDCGMGCIDKDMTIDSLVSVNVLLNSADSPEGTVVTFTNLNEGEQANHPMDPITLDATGFYRFPSFRKGDYTVTVEHDGYETITDTPVSIWEPVDLRYVMIEILYGIDNLYVSRTGWAMWDAQGDAPTPEPTPDPQGGTSFTEGFEGGLNGWTVLTVNADGGYWVHSDNNPGGYDYTTHAHGGSGFAMCYSFIDYDGAYNTDSYLITPQKYAITNGSTLTFWADNANDSYPENFSVCVATADNPTAADFTQVWSGSAKGTGAKANMRHDANRYDNWRSHSVDLSAYAGQNVYIAFHDVNYDAYEVWIDDVALTSGAKAGDRHLEYFKVMCESIDHEPIFNANTTHNFCQVATDQLVEGEHYICKVAAVYSTGQGPWSEVEWQYESCENYAGTVDGVTVEGNTVSWTYPGGDGPTPPPTGDTEFTEGFEGGLNGWTVLTVNADGGYWVHSSNNPGQYDYTTHAHGGSGFAMCYSFIDYDGAYNTDSYLITPQKYAITNGSTLTFWADNANDSYPENFSVCVATADNPGASDFTQVWSGSAKESGAKANVRHDANRYDNWRSHSIDLSAYAGQNVYIAFHDVNYDAYEVWIDDVALTAGAKSGNMNADNAPVAHNTTVHGRNAWDLMFTFTAPEAAQYGVVTDGNNFYTSNWGYSSAAHNFYKYDMEGNMIEGFEISGCGTLRGMTYDGTNFYGVANSSTVYCVDLANHSVVNTFTTSYGAMRGITYDPVRDGFWVIGNWSGSLTLIDRTGAVQFVGPIPTSASDLAYYKDENDVEHVFCFNNADNGVYDYNITTNTLGGSVFNFSNVPGFASGASSGGCHVATINGKMAFIGDMQQDPNLIGVYELRDDNSGPDPIEPTGNILGAMIFVDGEWEAFVAAPTNTYTYEGEGENICVRMVYDGEAELPDNNFYYAMSCEECAELNPEPQGCAPVENLTGYYQNDPEYGEAIFVEWDEPEGVVSYELYIGGELAGTLEPGSLPVIIYGLEGYPAMTLPIGVVAVYDDCESEMVEVNVNYDEVPENNLEVALFPNPTKDNVTIQAAGMNHITVMSVLGQVVYDAEVSSDEVILNMSQFNAGVYVVRIVTANGVGTRRVTVVK